MHQYVHVSGSMNVNLAQMNSIHIIKAYLKSTLVCPPVYVYFSQLEVFGPKFFIPRSYPHCVLQIPPI